MSDDTKLYYINIKDLSFRSEHFVVDLMRYLSEALPQINVVRYGNELEIVAPSTLSKRAIKLRIKKYLYRKKLNVDYRPIAYIDPDKDGYIVKEKKLYEFSYY